MLALGTLKNSRFFLNSSSFSDRARVMKLTCSTIHPGRCIVLLNTDLKDEYCSSTTQFLTHLTLTTYRLVTSDMTLNSIKQITPDLVFVGILNEMSSGLLFHSLSCAIFSCGTPCLLFFSSTGVRGFRFSCRVFAPFNDQRPLEILESTLSTLYEIIFLH